MIHYTLPQWLGCDSPYSSVPGEDYHGFTYRMLSSLLDSRELYTMNIQIIVFDWIAILRLGAVHQYEKACKEERYGMHTLSRWISVLRSTLHCLPYDRSGSTLLCWAIEHRQIKFHPGRFGESMQEGFRGDGILLEAVLKDQKDRGEGIRLEDRTEYDRNIGGWVKGYHCPTFCGRERSKRAEQEETGTGSGRSCIRWRFELWSWLDV